MSDVPQIADAAEQSLDESESAAHIIGLMRGEGSKRTSFVICSKQFPAVLSLLFVSPVYIIAELCTLGNVCIQIACRILLTS